MLKSYKYRIYPTDSQKELIEKTFGVCRLVYNLALEVRVYAWQTQRISVSAYDLQKQIVPLKEEYPWMKEINSQAIYGTLASLDMAFSNFFKGAGFPKKKYKRGKQSFRCHNNLRKIDWEASTLTIPKIKDIPIKLSRKFKGQIKTITISRSATDKYYASILVDNSNPIPQKPIIIEDRSIGIDMGLKSLAVTSKGTMYEPARFLKNSLRRLKCLQRRASKKKRGSRNKKKAYKMVAVLHEKITNKRSDYIHKITSELVNDNQVDTFIIEDLATKNLLKNKKISQSIADASWSEFFRQLKYKSEWNGKNFIVIGRYDPSSKRCSDCAMINDNLVLADREWTCSCGAQHDRDLNAAKNIKFFGLNAPEGIRDEPVESRQICRAKKRERKQNHLNTKAKKD